MNYRSRLLGAAVVIGFASLIGGCSSSGSSGASTSQVASGPAQLTEQISASSTDGVLFDIKLSGTLHDSDGDGSFRDEIEVLSPDSVEFQGHFPSADGDLVIVSCFADECQTSDRSAVFNVRYWISGT